jgi:RNA polymerase sigma factor (sigma-70 family)
MPRVPETRASLILRLPSTDDADAWREFVSIYEPFVFRFARRGGLQDADASELVQNVMLAVARAVGRWKPDSARGRFRTWLFRIARNQLLDILAKRSRDEANNWSINNSGLFDQVCSSSSRGLEELHSAQRRELFRWASDRVKNCVKPQTWQAFWMTAVEDQEPESVAIQLNMTTGAVYIARSRVISRLRDEVKKWEDDDAMQ